QDAKEVQPCAYRRQQADNPDKHRLASKDRQVSGRFGLSIQDAVQKKLKKRQTRLAARIEQYVQNPEDQDAVHDVRTTLRRLEAAFSLLPKKSRRAIAKYLKNCRKFFRANSKARDYDVIRARITSKA